MSKTIKEISEELGVSKTAIRKKIENLDLWSSLRKNGNQFLIEKHEETLIKLSFNESKTKTKTETKTKTDFDNISSNIELDNIINILQKQIERKDIQLEEKDKIIYQLNERLAECQKLLENQQVLFKNEQNRILLLDRVEENDKSNKKWYQFWK